MNLASRSRFADFDGINCRPAKEPLPPASSISGAALPEGGSFLDEHDPPRFRNDHIGLTATRAATARARILGSPSL